MYIELSARQARDHRLPRELLPSFLHNRPKPVISACLSSIEKAKAIDISTITEVDKVNGIYQIRSKNGEYSIDIKGETAHALIIHCAKYHVNTCSVFFKISTGFGMTFLHHAYSVLT